MCTMSLWQRVDHEQRYFSRAKIYTDFHLRFIAEEWLVRCLIAKMYSFCLICIAEKVIWRHDAIVWVWKSMSENVQDQWWDILDAPKYVCVGMESHLCEDKFEKFLNDANKIATNVDAMYVQKSSSMMCCDMCPWKDSAVAWRDSHARDLKCKNSSKHLSMKGNDRGNLWK